MYSEACVMPRLIFSKIMTPDYPTGDNYDGYEIIAYDDVPRESFPKLRKLEVSQLSEVEQNRLLKEDRTTILSVEKYACLKSSRLHFLIVPS